MIETLDKDIIAKHISSQFVGVVDIEVYACLPSTNRYLIEGLHRFDQSRPLVCICDQQTAGAGRRGKQWLSSKGSISFSLLFPFRLPARKLLGLSLVAGIAVCSVIKDLTGVKAELKWPNDIMVARDKLSGLLIELPKSSGENSLTVTGIGINYSMGEEEEQILQPVTSLHKLISSPPSRNELIGCAVGKLLNHYQQFEKGGMRGYMSLWDKYDYLRDKEVKVFLGDNVFEGKAEGVSEQGELRININGVTRSFMSGEVSVRRL